MIWCVLHFHGKFIRDANGATPTVLIAKVDSKGAFRQVPVERVHSPKLGYVFGDTLVVDRQLQF